MITLEEILMNRIKFEELPKELQNNLTNLNKCLNQFRFKYNKPMVVSSGYRSPSKNKEIGGAKQSAHMTCEACDFVDKNGALASFCLNNLDILEECELYLEDPSYTKGWVHLQTRKPKSGNRVFKPF